jgi:putative peptidoglycan lipid II flippase
MHDTKTPLRFALIRVGLASLLGYLFAIHVPRALGIAPQWGASALTLSSALAGWVEFTLLRRRLNARIGRTGLPARYVFTLWAAALAAGAVGFGVKLATTGIHRIITAALVLSAFGALYLALTTVFGLPEAAALARRLRRARR